MNWRSLLRVSDNFLAVEMALCKLLHDEYPNLTFDQFDNIMHKFVYHLNKILKEFDKSE